MLSFFGTSLEAKAQNFPLWVIGLVSDQDDMVWALENACIIDKSEYTQFRERTLPGMVRSLLWSHLYEDEKSLDDSDFMKALDLSTVPQLEDLIDAQRSLIHSCNPVCKALKEAREWHQPSLYIQAVINKIQVKINLEYLNFLAGRTLQHVSYKGRHSSSDNVYKESKPTSVWESKYVTKVPDNVTTTKNLFWLPIQPNRTSEENFAQLCLPDGSNPYSKILDFIESSNLIRTKKSGMTLSRTDEGEISATFVETDTKRIFSIYRNKLASTFSAADLVTVSRIADLVEQQAADTSGLSELSISSSGEITRVSHDASRTITLYEDDGDEDEAI